MASEIHQDDIGTRFLVTVKDDGVAVNLTSATLKQLNFRKPDDSVLNRTASGLGGGSESSGIMYYDTVAGDLDAVGVYKMQGKVTIPSGTFYTDIYTFKVHSNL
jgi:hypothetical protein